MPARSERRGSVVCGFSGIASRLSHPFRSEFQERCVEKLVNLGDAARDGKKHQAAIQHYSLAISLDPTNIHEILLKRSNEVRITLPGMSNTRR